MRQKENFFLGDSHTAMRRFTSPSTYPVTPPTDQELPKTPGTNFRDFGNKVTSYRFPEIRLNKVSRVVAVYVITHWWLGRRRDHGERHDRGP